MEGGRTLRFRNYFQTIAWAFAKKRRKLTRPGLHDFQVNSNDSSGNVTEDFSSLNHFSP